MSNLNDYQDKLADIEAIPKEKIKLPNMPVDTFLQEAEDLHLWAKDDTERLKTVGITEDKIDELALRAGACRRAQSIWNKDYRSQQEARKEWAKQSPEAILLRNDLLVSMRFAYRNEPALLSRVKAITEGSSYADMIQDLSDIAVLGQENPEPLLAISFDLKQLELADTRSSELATLLAEANGDRASQNESKLTRDKAYTYLKELVDEIRQAGRYVFRTDESREVGYISPYYKKMNYKNRKGTTDLEE